MENNTLSVIMTNYNHAKFIGDALEAILNQSYRPSEVIVIDDTSTDNSVEIIEQFVRRDTIVRLIKNEKNMGANHNVKKLLDLARGDYVCVASADDKILLGFFEKSMNLLAQYPQAGLCSSLTLIIDEDGKNKSISNMPVISKRKCFIPPDKALSILRKEGSWIQGISTIYRRDALIDSGGFILELHSFSDGFILQVIALKYGACFIPEPLACWRRMESGYASTCGKNPVIAQSVIHHAVYLMENSYNNLFPQDYIDQWQKEQIYRMNKYIFLSRYKQKVANFLPYSQSILYKVFISILQFVMRCGFLIFEIYLAVISKVNLRILLMRKMKIISFRAKYLLSERIKRLLS